MGRVHSPTAMKRLAATVLLLVAASASAQTNAAAAVTPGERVRVTLVPAPAMPLGVRTLLDGRVAQVTADTLRLIGDAGMSRVAWADVAGIERRVQSRGREGLGMLAGVVGGGLAGYAFGPTLSGGDSLGRLMALPGALVGLLVGGVAGAHSGETWRPVP